MKVYLYVFIAHLDIFNRMLNQNGFLEESAILTVYTNTQMERNENYMMVSINYDQYVRLLDSGKLKIN